MLHLVKGFLPMIYTGAGIAAAGGVGYTVYNNAVAPQPEPVALVQPAPETEQPVVAAPKPEPAPEVAADEPALVPPAFTLLRVEPDGSTVIAGSGPGDADILLFNGDNEISKTKSGSEGDFAFVLDEPLSPGIHELHLLAKTADGKEIASTQAGIINVPEPDKPEEATVLVSEAGAPTQVLQQPEPEEPAKTEEVAAAEPAVEPETPEPVVEAKAEPEPAPEPVAEPEQAFNLVLEAADIESGKIFIAGKGEPGSTVNLYIENELLGFAEVNNKGAFLFEGDRKVDAGEYDIRADLLARGSSKVIARAEVKLVHNPEPVVASAEEPKEVEESRPVLRTGTAVIIRKGDNLWRLARRSYGDGVRYTTIFEANKAQIRNPDLIYPGQVFKVPDASEAG